MAKVDVNVVLEVQLIIMVGTYTNSMICNVLLGNITTHLISFMSFSLPRIMKYDNVSLVASSTFFGLHAKSLRAGSS